ncbi:phage portal protein [Atopococcus tabaci]|uniref:phage portal protein n=1 Tax=Atopococcus tabaci TaxID=269774 RepID=UPI00240A2B21|nr:phage portal protein [Atopococcus tabaci]
MFETIKNWIRKVGVTLGLIKEIKRLEDVQHHRPINATEEEYTRMELNKKIYQGYVDEWHKLEYRPPGATVPATREILRMGMGKVLANEMASLIFNEKCYITIDDEKTNEFIESVFQDNDFYYNFQRYLEYAYALGGMIMKLYVEGDKVKIGWAKADSFVPLGNNAERVEEVLFTYKRKQNDKYYTLLEWHELIDGEMTITNEVYVSDKEGALGTKTSLASWDPDLEAQSKLEGIKPLFTYVRSAEANNINLDSPLGISIYENVHDQLKFLDRMFDFWFNEFELGRRRIAVSKEMVQWHTDPHTGHEYMAFDPDESVYVVLDADDMKEPKDMAVELRTDDIIGSINSLLNVIAMKTGFSAGTFSFDGKSMKTATEVVSENSKTYRTKNSNENIVESALIDLVESILDLAEAEGIFTAPDEYQVSVSFDDSIAQDRDSNFKHYSAAAGMGLMPELIAIQRIFDVPEETAKEWLEMIDERRQKKSPINANMADFIGME